MKRGFSLIEMLVSIGIVMIIFGAGIASYRNATRTQALDSDISLIIQVLNIAKTNVNSGKKVECTLPLRYWQVEFNSSGFKLNEVCEDESIDGQIKLNNTYKLSSSKTIVANPSKFNFKALGLGSTSGSIVLDTKTVSVTSLGLIQVQ